MAYWDALPQGDKDSRLEADPAYWRFVRFQLSGFTQPFTSEPTLRVPFSNAYHTPHNIAIRGANDVHAEMWTEGSRLEKPPIGNADFIFVYDGKITGVIELKTWWKVTETQIEDVKAGILHRNTKCKANGEAANHWTEFIMDVLLLNKHMAIWYLTRSYTESCPHSIHSCL